MLNAMRILVVIFFAFVSCALSATVPTEQTFECEFSDGIVQILYSQSDSRTSACSPGLYLVKGGIDCFSKEETKKYCANKFLKKESPPSKAVECASPLVRREKEAQVLTFECKKEDGKIRTITSSSSFSEEKCGCPEGKALSEEKKTCVDTKDTLQFCVKKFIVEAPKITCEAPLVVYKDCKQAVNFVCTKNDNKFGVSMRVGLGCEQHCGCPEGQGLSSKKTCVAKEQMIKFCLDELKRGQ